MSKVFVLTVAGDAEQKVYVKEESVQCIFPSKDGDGCLIYLKDQVQIAVNEPVYKHWLAQEDKPQNIQDQINRAKEAAAANAKERKSSMTLAQRAKEATAKAAVTAESK